MNASVTRRLKQRLVLSFGSISAIFTPDRSESSKRSLKAQSRQLGEMVAVFKLARP